jgi:hypothetical protein
MIKGLFIITLRYANVKLTGRAGRGLKPLRNLNIAL